MSLRFRKSIRVAKGVRVNVGKKGASVSFGTRGLRHSIHTSGRRTSSVGLPGTGLSYTKTSTSGKSRNTSRSAAQQQRAMQIEENEAQVQAYDEMIQKLTSVHQECDDFVDWAHIHAIPAPFQPPEPGPRQLQAIHEAENFKPNFFEKIFPAIRERRRSKLESAVQQAVKLDQDDYEEWESLHKLSGRILQGDIDSYFQVIQEMKPLDDLLEFGSEFEFGTDDSEKMEVEFKVKPGLIPDYSLSLTKTGRLSNKKLTKTNYYALIQDYVCSCSIRIARDMMALLPVNKVIVHAVEESLNTATGYNEEQTVLSVVFERDNLNRLNFERIDPSDAMENFPHQMEFRKTMGFKPVNRMTDK